MKGDEAHSKEAEEERRKKSALNGGGQEMHQFSSYKLRRDALCVV